MKKMENKKYKLTGESIEVKGKTLYRIEALKDFCGIKKGDKGGYVESEKNLSQKGNCWIYDDACAFDDAIVKDNASVSDYAQVYGNAIVYDDAWLYDNSRVCGNACVSGSACVYDNASVGDNSRVFGNALVYDNARVYNNASVSSYAQVHGNVWVYGCARVSDNARVCGNARVYGDALVRGDACVCGDAEISTDADYIVFKNWWSSGRYFTWTRSNNMWSVGCFYGTGDELVKKAHKDSSKSGRQYERIVKYVEETLKEEENGGH